MDEVIRSITGFELDSLLAELLVGALTATLALLVWGCVVRMHRSHHGSAEHRPSSEFNDLHESDAHTPSVQREDATQPTRGSSSVPATVHTGALGAQSAEISGQRVDRLGNDALLLGRRIPANARPYRRLPQDGWFTAESMPKGLLKEHSLKSGVWGLLKMRQGSMLYRERFNAHEKAPKNSDARPNADPPRCRTARLVADSATAVHVIPPATFHEVDPQTADVEFAITFHRIEADRPSTVTD